MWPWRRSHLHTAGSKTFQPSCNQPSTPITHRTSLHSAVWGSGQQCWRLLEHFQRSPCLRTQLQLQQSLQISMCTVICVLALLMLALSNCVVLLLFVKHCEL